MAHLHQTHSFYLAFMKLTSVLNENHFNEMKHYIITNLFFFFFPGAANEIISVRSFIEIMFYMMTWVTSWHDTETVVVDPKRSITTVLLLDVAYLNKCQVSYWIQELQ